MVIKKVVKYVDMENDFEYMYNPIDDTIHIEETKEGFEVRYLISDMYPESLDEWSDDTLFLVHYHRSFTVVNDICPKNTLGYLYTQNETEYNKEDAEQVLKDYWVFFVSAYIHSGVHLSLQSGNFNPLDQQGWDTSHTGAVLVKKKEFGSGGVEFELSKEDAETRAESSVKEWNSYLSGDIYCLVKETYDTDRKPIDYDCIGGFVGFDHAKECLLTEI